MAVNLSSLTLRWKQANSKSFCAEGWCVAGNSSHKAEGSRLFNGVITLCVVMTVRGDISLQMLASKESALTAVTGRVEPWDIMKVI